MVKSNDIISNIAKDNSKSSEMLLDIFELNPDAIALTRVSDGKIIDCNQAYLNQIGYSRDEVIGHTSIELNLLSPKERQAFVNNIQRKKTLTDYEINVKKKDGSFIYVLYSARFITIDGEEIILSIGHEITKRKKLEEENQSFLKDVQDERDKLSTLINSIPDEIWFADKNKKFSLANPSALHEFGLFSSNVDVEELASNLEVYRPDGSPRPVEEAPPLRALKGETVRNMEEIIRTPSRNELRYRQVNASPVKDKNGNTIGAISVVRDITEQKNAANELKVSEQKYHSLYSSMNEGVALHEIIYNTNHKPVDYIITDINPAYETIVDLKQSEVVGKKASELYGTGTPPYMEIYSNVAENGESTEFETFFEPMNKYFKISVISPEKGKFATIFEDITKRKRVEKQKQDLLEKEQQLTEELQVSNEELMEQGDKLLLINKALKESEERFRSIIENIQDAYMRTDKEGNIIMASPSAARMYRFNSTQEMLGTTTLSYFKNSEDRDFAIEQLTKYGKLNDYEVEARRNDGTFFWVSQNAQYYYDDQGKILGRESIVRDITVRKRIEAALKKSERNLDEAQHIAHIGSWEWNIKTGNITWSKELYSIYGVDPNTFIPTLTSFTDYLHPDDEKFVNQHIDQILSEGKSNFDFRIILDDDSIRVLNTMAEVAEFDKNGEPNIIIGINQDITKRKEIELKLNENIKKLAQSNKELEQFAYITSHDLREPLRMITSFLQLLERRYKDKLDQDAKEFIGFAVDGAKRLDAMTNDLLEYSRITNQKRDLTPVNFENVLEKALINLKVPIEENNAIVTHDPLPTINGDEQLKVQLFQNLISNSIKYRSQEPPKIHISAKKEKNQYLFSIKDNGIGMSSEHLEQIFTIFKRLHTQENYEGTGIGLAIAQKIVHQQGGQIWVESEPGKGSTFYFTIPNQNY